MISQRLVEQYQALENAAAALVACERGLDGKPIQMIEMMSLLADLEMVLADLTSQRQQALSKACEHNP